MVVVHLHRQLKFDSSHDEGSYRGPPLQTIVILILFYVKNFLTLARFIEKMHQHLQRQNSFIRFSIKYLLVAFIQTCIRLWPLVLVDESSLKWTNLA